MSNAQSFHFTKEGFENLKKELVKLETRRPIVVVNLTNAREQGDLSENAGYHAAKEELGQIDSRVNELKYLLRLGEIVESQASTSVAFGNTVTLHNGENELTFTIVEQLEANPATGKISIDSPIGKSVLGKRLDDVVKVTTPTGTVKLKVLKIA